MVRWQDINKTVINSVATIGAFGVILMISLLARVEVSYTNWENCTDNTDCYARFEVNTSYWRVCFNIDDSVTTPQFFKKQSRSRTMWINTSRYGFIDTEPNIQTKLMFGTYKSRSIEQAPDGKWLRDVKTGDCIERSKVNYLYIKGEKESWETVKWSADLFEIDPIWIGEGEDSIELKSECVKFSNRSRFVVDKIVEKFNEKNQTYYNETIYKEEIVQVCVEYHQFIDKVDMTNLNVSCKDYPTQIICDSRIVNREGDGNGDGICQAGESCIIFDKSKKEYIGTDYLGKRLVNQFKKEQIIGVSI